MSIMQVIATKITQNPAIVKFELDEIIVRTENFEFKNIDETQNSPLAKQLFFLPFVKTVYVSGNFIAIEKFSIVEWEDVQEDVANQINEFISNGGEIIKIDETKTKKQPITVYAETTPNPSVLKFVCNKLLTKTALECKNIDETSASPLAKELFKFPFVKEVFIDENYISVTKFAITEWDEITLELRTNYDLARSMSRDEIIANIDTPRKRYEVFAARSVNGTPGSVSSNLARTLSG